MIGRLAGTVSSSGLSIVRRTLRSFSSGSHSSTGSSSLTRHSSTRIMAPTAVIGLVVEASRKIVSRRTGTLLSKAMVPIVSSVLSPALVDERDEPGDLAAVDVASQGGVHSRQPRAGEAAALDRGRSPGCLPGAVGMKQVVEHGAILVETDGVRLEHAPCAGGLDDAAEAAKGR